MTNPPDCQEFDRVRARWPEWTDDQIRRHLKDRAELAQQADQQRRQRVSDAIRALTTWGPQS